MHQEQYRFDWVGTKTPSPPSVSWPSRNPIHSIHDTKHLLISRSHISPQLIVIYLPDCPITRVVYLFSTGSASILNCLLIRVTGFLLKLSADQRISKTRNIQTMIIIYFQRIGQSRTNILYITYKLLLSLIMVLLSKYQ